MAFVSGLVVGFFCVAMNVVYLADSKFVLVAFWVDGSMKPKQDRPREAWWRGWCSAGGEHIGISDLVMDRWEELCDYGSHCLKCTPWSLREHWLNINWIFSLCSSSPTSLPLSFLEMWEKAIQLSKELADMYENKVFDYEGLGNLLVRIFLSIFCRLLTA